MFGKRRTYLDYAAGASANPSSPHEEGRKAKETLEHARTRIARVLEVQSDDVVFTGGATEANALAILGHARALRAPGTGAIHVLYAPGAHASIVENVKLLAAEGAHIEALPIRDARIDTDALQKMLRPETSLVAMEAVCGETGVVWNTLEVRRALDAERGAGGERIVLHVDASQAPLTEKMTRAHFGADTLALDASKISPVRGIGALVAHRTLPLAPLYAGGGQERGLRPGSEAPELARGFAEALTRCADGREAFRASAEASRKRLVNSLTHAATNLYIEGGKAQAPHILTISLPGRDTDYLVALLDEEGFAVSTRSACETLKSAGSTFQPGGSRSEPLGEDGGSRTVFALTGSAERARSTLRISWGPEAKARDLERFADAFRRSLAFIDSGPS